MDIINLSSAVKYEYKHNPFLSSFLPHSQELSVCSSLGKNSEWEKVEKVHDVSDTYKNRKANITINI